MNTQFFVVSNASQTKDISDLLPGQLGIYAMNKNTGLLENCSGTTECDRFVVAAGKTSGVVVNSRDIPVSKHLRRRNFIWKKDPYREPVSAVFNLTSNALGRTGDDEFEIKINTVSAYEGFHGIDQFFKSWSVVGTFPTYRALYDALANEINSDNFGSSSDQLFFKSATSDDNGVQITAFPGQRLNIVFLYHPDYSNKCLDCKGSAETKVEQVVDGDVGAGTPDLMRAIASEVSVWNGQAYSGNRLFSNSQDDYTISSTAKYNMYQLRWTSNTQVDESQSEPAFNQYQTLIIGVANTVDMSYVEQAVSALLGQPLEISPLF